MARHVAGTLGLAALWPALLVAQGDLACRTSDAKNYGALGIGWYHCIGGSCASSDEPGNRFYRFSSEPRLRDVASNGPAGSAGIRSGDVLAAIDRTPITAAEGGARLGGLKPGQPVTLTLRRDGRLVDATVTPVAGCGMPGIVVTSSDRWPVQWNAVGGVRVGGRGGGDEAATGVGVGGGGGAARGTGVGARGSAGGAGTSVTSGARGVTVGTSVTSGDEAVSVAAPVRAQERVGNVGVTVRGAPVRWHRDPATGDYVITTSTNTIRLTPPKRGNEE